MSTFIDLEYERAPFSVRIVKFGCENCGRRWQSANGSLEDYQKCKNCYQKCYPSSYKIQAPNKRGNENKGTYQAHDTELCGKCARLGFSCIEQLGNTASNRDEVLAFSANEEEVVLSKSNDLAYFIVPKNKKSNKRNKGKNSNSGTSKNSIQTNVPNQSRNSRVGSELLQTAPNNNANKDTPKLDPLIAGLQDKLTALRTDNKPFYDDDDSFLSLDAYYTNEERLYSEDFYYDEYH